MHVRTFVLLPPDTSDLRGAAAALLRPHRLDEDAPERPWRLDFWTVGWNEIGDPDTATSLGVADDPDLAPNVCRVSRLPPDVLPGAVVTPDGRWHDLADHGHRPLRGRSWANRRAEAAWQQAVRALLADHPDHLVLAVDTHA